MKWAAEHAQFYSETCGAPSSVSPTNENEVLQVIPLKMATVSVWCCTGTAVVVLTVHGINWFFMSSSVNVTMNPCCRYQLKLCLNTFYVRFDEWIAMFRFEEQMSLHETVCVRTSFYSTPYSSLGHDLSMRLLLPKTQNCCCLCNTRISGTKLHFKGWVLLADFPCSSVIAW